MYGSGVPFDFVHRGVRPISLSTSDSKASVTHSSSCFRASPTTKPQVLASAGPHERLCHSGPQAWGHCYCCQNASSNKDALFAMLSEFRESDEAVVVVRLQSLISVRPLPILHRRRVLCEWAMTHRPPNQSRGRFCSRLHMRRQFRDCMSRVICDCEWIRLILHETWIDKDIEVLL